MASPYQLLTKEAKAKAEVIAAKEYPHLFRKKRHRNPNTQNYYDWLKQVALDEAAKKIKAS